jgi:hypothetical protein
MCPKELRNTMKDLSQDGLCLGRDSNRALPECKSRALPLHQAFRFFLETELYACIKLTLKIRLWCMIPKQLFSNYTACSTVLEPPLQRLLSGLCHTKTLFRLSSRTVSLFHFLSLSLSLSLSLPLLFRSSSIFLCLCNPIAVLVPRFIARAAPPPPPSRRTQSLSL